MSPRRYTQFSKHTVVLLPCTIIDTFSGLILMHKLKKSFRWIVLLRFYNEHNWNVDINSNTIGIGTFPEFSLTICVGVLSNFLGLRLWSVSFSFRTWKVFELQIMQDHLGEVVFVEVPEPGGSVAQGSSFGAVESVKATSDVNSPISGDIVEVNTKLTESPGLVIFTLLHPQLFFFFPL